MNPEWLLVLALMSEPRQYRPAPPIALPAPAAAPAPAKPEPARLSPADRAKLDAAIDAWIRSYRQTPENLGGPK